MKKILISKCLLGEKVRYDGQSKPLEHPVIQEWDLQGRLVPVCPEIQGGLPVPRPPAEICQGTGAMVLEETARVVTQSADVTRAFIRGARQVLQLARDQGITLALLKARSPSCGSSFIYDGSFSGRLIPGAGVTAALLSAHGIQVFSENEIVALQTYLE